MPAVYIYIYIVTARPLSPQEGARSRSPQLCIVVVVFSTPREAPKLTLDNLNLLLALVDGASSHHRLPTNASEAADVGSCAGVGYSLSAGGLVVLLVIYTLTP